MKLLQLHIKLFARILHNASDFQRIGNHNVEIYIDFAYLAEPNA